MLEKIKELLKRKLKAEDTDDWKKLIIQFIKFGLVGVSNTLVSWACYYLFIWINEELYLLGGFVGTVVSIANAFYWNDKYVFKGGKNDLNSKLKRLGKTYISYGGTSLLGMLLLWLEVDILGMNKIIVPMINLIITIPLNFLINKLWTFKKQS